MSVSKPQGRTRWCNQLVQILETPSLQAQHERAGGLLDMFATRDNGESLVAIMLDRTRDTWSRIYCLRALERCNIPVGASVLEELFREFLDNEVPAFSHTEQFTNLRNVYEMLALAKKSGQIDAATSFLRRCSGDARRWMIKHAQLSTELVDVAYECELDAGRLDLELAYATLTYRPSRSLIVDSEEPIDPQRLGDALSWIHEDLLQSLLAERPSWAAMVLPDLALPLPFLLKNYSEEELGQRALALLERGAEDQRRHRPPSWCLKPIRVLSQLTDGHLLLDQLIDQSEDESVRIMSARARLRMSPAPEFDRLPIEALMGPLRYAEPADRDVYRWLLESEVPVEQWHGFQGLACLGLDHVEARFRNAFRDSTEPLFRIAALGVDAALGDAAAARKLRDYVHDSPHVELRAEALRYYGQAHPLPQDLLQVCAAAIRDDQERLGHHLPVVEEAVRGLREQEGLKEDEALALLIEASLNVTEADIDWFVTASIRSWLEGDHTHTMYPQGWGRQYLYDRMDRDEWIISKLPPGTNAPLH